MTKLDFHETLTPGELYLATHNKGDTSHILITEVKGIYFIDSHGIKWVSETDADWNGDNEQLQWCPQPLKYTGEPYWVTTYIVDLKRIE